MGAALVALGCSVIIGWQFDIVELKSVLPGLATMKANTAVGFLLTGLTLLLANKQLTQLRALISRVCAGMVTLLGLLTLGEYMSGLNFGIDQLIFRDLQTPVASYPGRMSITAALNFSLLGIALLILGVETTRGVRPAQFLALSAGAVASIALIGYLYGVESLYSVSAYSSMALHTALGFTFVTLGVLFARPQAGWMAIVSSESIGGIILRRLILIAGILPITLGWFRLWGERAGFYDSNFGLALMVILSVASLSVIIWLNAGWLNNEEVERRKAENAFHGSESLKADILESALDCIITIDHQGRVLEFNPAAQKTFGYSLEQVLGNELVELIIPESLREQHRLGLKRYLTTGESKILGKRIEMPALRADGGLLSMELTITWVPDSAPPMFTGFLRDITENKRAEEQNRFQANLVASVADAVIATDMQLKIQSWNTAAETMYGWKAEEVFGRPAQEILDTDFLENRREVVTKQIMEQGHWQGEVRQLRRDGTRIPTLSSVSLYKDLAGRPAGVVAVNRDITDLKRAEESIRKLNEELEERVVERTNQLAVANRELENGKREIQNIFDSMTTLNAQVAPDGRLLLVNRIAAQASGLSMDELMNTNFLDGQWWAFDPEVQNRVRNTFAQACTGTPINYDEKILAFGQVLTINFSLTPLFGNNGRVEYILAEGRNITKLKEIEEALQAKTLQLEAANKELDAFSHSVSHDLRAPLRTIDGFSQALLEDYSEQLPAEGRSYLERVRKSAQHMAELIDGLLNLSRMTRTPMRNVPINLTRLAQDIATELQSTQPERKVSFQIASNLKTQGDPNLLQAVLQNLMNNAWKYTSKRAQAEIQFGSKQEGDETIYFIRDNGAGFDMTYAGKLFGAFQRLHATVEFPGTGIGLATVQRIIHRHGGRIWAEAEVDRGATFFFSLPGEEHAQPKEQDSMVKRVREII